MEASGASEAKTPLVIVLTGPTASGKTALAVELARSLECDILSADSRQLYRDIPIGTAAPTPQEMKGVRHHFVGTLGLADYYSAAAFEEDALALLAKLWEHPRADGGTHRVIVAGGSMMYIDALVRGIDDMPTVSDRTRSYVKTMVEQNGLAAARTQLEILDPVYAAAVDPSNTRRVMHALELCLEAGQPYSTLLSGRAKPRPFRVLKLAIDMEREELFERINLRVDKMIEDGLEDEARRAFAHGEDLNSLNTVGYRELREYFHGRMDRPTAIARIAKNTRVYAKKQLTWLKKDPSVRWIPAHTAPGDILKIITSEL